jgi:DNA invertase Pin-like site-specific DNA recombinase
MRRPTLKVVEYKHSKTVRWVIEGIRVKGRRPTGRKVAQVRKLRDKGVSLKEVAERFGISVSSTFREKRKSK